MCGPFVLHSKVDRSIPFSVVRLNIIPGYFMGRHIGCLKSLGPASCTVSSVFVLYIDQLQVVDSHTEFDQ